jgi:Flp pilus assembly protein TadG
MRLFRIMLTLRQAKDVAVRETGSVTVLVVAFLPILLLMMGFSVDAGRIIAAKTELYKASDIAARELARRIDVVSASETGLQVREVTNEDAAVLIEDNLDGTCGATIEDIEVENTETHLSVTCRADVLLLFCGLINRKSATISVTGLARLKPYTPSSTQQ